MDFEDYRRHDAVGLAELVARREVSPGELLDAAAARMAEVNPKINAVTLGCWPQKPKHSRQPEPTPPLRPARASPHKRVIGRRISSAGRAAVL